MAIDDFLQKIRLVLREITASNSMFISVDRMRHKYAHDPMVKNFIDKGKQKTWKKEMPEEYVERLDALTRKFFQDDEILANVS